MQPHSGAFKTCTLRRAKDAANSSALDNENKKKHNAKALEKTKQRRDKANPNAAMTSQSKLPL